MPPSLPLGQRPPVAPGGRQRTRCSAFNHEHALLQPLPSEPHPSALHAASLPAPLANHGPFQLHAASLPTLLADHGPFQRHSGYPLSRRFFNGLHPRALPPALSFRQSTRRRVIQPSIRLTSSLALPAAASNGQRLLRHAWSPR